MATALTWDLRARTEQNLLVRSFVLSLAAHLLLFGLVEVGHRQALWQFSPLAALLRWLKPEVKELAAQPRDPPPRATPPSARTVQEVPVIFVDVDPAQASDTPPERTPYYAAVDSRAGNPDTSRDTGQPRLDGTQTLVPKTQDTLRAQPSPASPPAPPQAAAPAEPPRPNVAPAGVAASPPEPPLVPPPPRPAPQELQNGDLAMLDTPPPRPPEVRVSPAATPTEAPAESRPRPRTLAAARAQMHPNQNPDSALVGQKLFQEGGVRRFSLVPSLDTRGTPLGNYDARFVAAVQQCWFALLDEQRYSLDRVGRVVISFRLTAEGRITDMRVEETDVGEIYTTICQLAITKPAPYEKWPADVRRLVGQDYRDIRFTFYY